MRPRIKKRILFDLLLLSYLLFSYYALGGWWNSFAGFLLILLFARLIWQKEFLRSIGLDLTLQIVIKSVFSAILIIFLSYLLINYLAARNGISITKGNWRDYFHQVFYILNEEIVLGAIILFYLTRTRNLNAAVSCALLAVFFAIIHFIFYKWIFADKGILSWLTLTTLFFIGFLRNSLILLTGHIGYSWALHFGWMAIMFGSIHTYAKSDKWLSEPFRFNYYLGSAEMLIVSALLATAGLYFVLRGKKSLQL